MLCSHGAADPCRQSQFAVAISNRKARGSGHERLGEILSAAKELFLEHGYESVSTRKIAQRVGISQTALFTYYKTKDDILGQLIRDAFEELRGRLAKVDRSATDLHDWFRRAVAGYIAFGLHYPDEYRLALMVLKSYRKPYNSEPEEQTSDWGLLGVSVFVELEKKVAEAMRAGIIRTDRGTSMLIAQVLWASIHGLVAILISRPRPHFPWDELDILVAAQTDMLMNGILAETARAAPAAQADS
jgi:AcrR family transcriptional regulator